jgi:hypothetical protein
MRLVGTAVTVAAVLLLLASLVVDMDPSGSPRDYQVIAATSATTAASRIRVEVLNGAGIAGLAREVTERLRDQGFDVVYYGNASPALPDSTVVLDRAGNQSATEAVAAALGIERIETVIDTTLYLEATVVLGPDWEDGREQGIGNREQPAATPTTTF